MNTNEPKKATVAANKISQRPRVYRSPVQIEKWAQT